MKEESARSLAADIIELRDKHKAPFAVCLEADDPGNAAGPWHVELVPDQDAEPKYFWMKLHDEGAFEAQKYNWGW